MARRPAPEVLESRVARTLGALSVTGNTAGRFPRKVIEGVRARLHGEVDAAVNRLRVEDAPLFDIGELYRGGEDG